MWIKWTFSSAVGLLYLFQFFNSQVYHAYQAKHNFKKNYAEVIIQNGGTGLYIYDTKSNFPEIKNNINQIYNYIIRYMYIVFLFRNL